MKRRPDLTSRFPAIDGIAKPERNHHRDEDCMGNPETRFDPAEDEIRPDILALIEMPQQKFDEWYSLSISAVNSLLWRYEAVAAIPSLGCGFAAATFGGHLCIRSTLETLQEAKQHLELIKQRREEYRSSW